MENKKSIHFDSIYNDESNLVENLYEFHPHFFEELSASELEALQEYYLYLVPTTDYPDDVFKYKLELVRKKPAIEKSAKAAYSKLLSSADVKEW